MTMTDRMNEDPEDQPRQYEKPEFLLERYRELWTDLNAVNGLIEDLEDRRKAIKERQRQLANKLASLNRETP